MECEVCVQSISALVGGLIAVIFFIINPMIELFFASIKLILSKVGVLKD